MIRLRISNLCIDQIGDILVNDIPLLKPHIRWCSCQLNACTLLQNKSTQSQEFREFEQKCMMDPRTAGLPMSSFLLKPMQRVTKYPLLIDRVRLLCTLCIIYHKIFCSCQQTICSVRWIYVRRIECRLNFVSLSFQFLTFECLLMSMQWVLCFTVHFCDEICMGKYHVHNLTTYVLCWTAILQGKLAFCTYEYYYS